MTTYIDPTNGQTIGYRATKGTIAEPFNVPMLWQASTLSYVSMLADAIGNLAVSGGGGGGGGAVTIADGADVAEGYKADSAIYGDVAGTVSAKLRGINALLQGVGAANAPATASVTNADSTVLAANAIRKKLVITNIGATNVFFGDGQSAALNSGIVLTSNGTWVMDSYTFSTAAIHAICATTSILAIQEYQ
jgi:hypothetical protein